MPVRGEALGVVTNWPPSLEAALQRWGTISPKAPCLTSLDTAGKPLYVLTYGRTLGLYTKTSTQNTKDSLSVLCPLQGSCGLAASSWPTTSCTNWAANRSPWCDLETG